MRVGASIARNWTGHLKKDVNFGYTSLESWRERMNLLRTSRHPSAACFRWSREPPSLLAAHRPAVIVAGLPTIGKGLG